MDNRDVTFVKISNQEVLSKFDRLRSSNVQFRLWKKGSEVKEIFHISLFDSAKAELVLFPENSKSSLKEQNILYTFEQNGLQFFSSGYLKYNSITDVYTIEIKESVYKCERRENFRVLTDLVYNVYVGIKIALELKEQEQSNVLDIKTGTRRTGYTGIFKKFLELIGDKGDQETGVQSGSFRVVDLSTTGLSLYIGEPEKKYFEENEIFSNIVIVFEKDEFLIDEMKLVYIADNLHSGNLLKKYRVGFKFTKIDQKVSAKLYTKLFHSVKDRQIDQLFEDKIK
ncbi:MAG: hypothetical protein U0T83_04970 [Bacteriovoracaceae bacterium]